MLHVDDLNDKIIDMVNHLLDKGLLDPEEYVGFDYLCTAKPFEVKLGNIHVADIVFIMNEGENGDYDGLEGYDVIINPSVVAL